MKIYLFFLPFFLILSLLSQSQQLKPGFDQQEYTNLMKVSAQVGDSAYRAGFPVPGGYQMVYRSPVMGLDNLWDLWMTNTRLPVISIRGTTLNEISWMANFYGAMVPAKGELQITNEIKFPYQLASNPAASVHVGWLVGMAFLATDMMPKIDSLYKGGHREIYIMGHSQGGGIAFLLTAYLYNLQKQQLLPADIRFKTYCSAGPKPGNLYFAHEYEAMTQQGWAYNVVNSADWVPETLVSVQTVNDFNAINPFVNIKGFIKKQSFIKRLAINHAYKKLTKHNQKAANNYRKYLGGYVAKAVKKHLPGFVEPVYASTNDYVRTGNGITLLADEAYYKAFPQERSNVFINHLHAPYLYLTNQLDMNTTTGTPAGSIKGSWELIFLAGDSGDLNAVYPGQKPFITLVDDTINGSTGCNNFNGRATIAGNTIAFPPLMATTRKMCPGNGEQLFLAALKNTNSFQLINDELNFLSGNTSIMRFKRK